MDLGRHLATQNLLGTLDGQTGDLLTQDFTGLHGQLISFCLGISNDLGTFVGSTLFGVVDDGGCTLFSVSNALSDLVADWESCSWTLLLAFASSSFALSAAARPSAILVARSSRAFVIGGHTNFIVNHQRIPKTTICANSVAFRFTARTFLG